MFARYYEEGTDPHRKMPTRNGDFRGDEESDAKAETSDDSRGGTNGISDPKTKTLTGRHAKNSAEEDNRTKTHTWGHTRDFDRNETRVREWLATLKGDFVDNGLAAHRECLLERCVSTVLTVRGQRGRVDDANVCKQPQSTGVAGRTLNRLERTG